MNINTLVTSLSPLPNRVTKTLLAFTLYLIAGFQPTLAVAELGLTEAVIDQLDSTFDDAAAYTAFASRDAHYCGRIAKDETQLKLCIARQADYAESELNETYRDAMGELSPTRRKALRQEERDWIKWREAECAMQAEECCGVPWTMRVVCMIKEANNRVDQLKTNWYQSRPISEDSHYKIVMSKDKQLCTHIRNVLDQDLSNYGPGYDPRKFAAPIFSAITWTPIKGLEEGFDYIGAYARIDINNDGVTDLVVKQEAAGLKDLSYQRLYVLTEDQYPAAILRLRELEEQAIGSVDFYMSHYDFLALPPRTLKSRPFMKGKKSYVGLWVVYIHPFRFSGVTYLLITRTPDLAPEYGDEPYWTLVAKYKKGKVKEADPLLLEDMCYLN